MNLQLSLKKQWFDLTEPNGKLEDYREITHYWEKRLVNPLPKNLVITYKTLDGKIDGLKKRGFKLFTQNIMTLGYHSKNDTSRIKIFEHAGIEIGYGKPEWGAEPNKLYFIIKHGKRIQ